MTVARTLWLGIDRQNANLPKAVRPSAPITFVEGEDFFRTDRGTFWGIKVTKTDDVQMVHVFEKAGASWTVGAELGGLGWIEDCKRDHGGDVRKWFKAVALPKLNTWLAQRFPALDAPPADDLSSQLDRLIVGSLSIKKNADGTLIASMP